MTAESDHTWNAASESWPPAPPAPTAGPAATEPPTAPTPAVAPTAQQPQTPAAPASWPPASTSAWPTSPPRPPSATPPTAPPGGWSAPPAPPPPEPMSAGKRIGAAIAALLLVIASAGVGAAVANAMHKNSSSSTASPFSPNGNSGSNTNPFGGSGNPFGGSNGSSGSSGSSGSNGSSGSSSTANINAAAIASKVTPSIVNVTTTLPQGRAAGTGIIISSSGLMLTNNHVIADATSITADIGGTGNTHPAKVIGYDVQDDVALVQIEGVSGLPVVTFGDPSAVNVGDPVVAIGNALGKGGTPTVSSGKVTALNQTVTAGDAAGGSTETLHGMIQIDAPIQPGDSGGALIDASGKVIGINTAAAGGRFRQQTGSNIGFSIPIDNAVSIAHQIQNGDETNGVHIGPRALLGVSVEAANDPSGASGVQPAVNSGALVTNVQSGSGASNIGLQAGDVITAIDGQTVDDDQGLRNALTKNHPGDKVEVTWVDSSGTTHTASAQLGEGPPA